MQEKTTISLISAPPFWMERSSSTEAISEKQYHYHDCYQLYYLYSGELYYFIKDKTYLVKPGNIVLIKNYDIHCTFTSSQKSYERLIIDFKKEFIRDMIPKETDVDLFGCFERSIHLLKLNMQEQKRFEGIFNGMNKEYGSSMPGNTVCLKAQLIELLTLINRHTSGEEATADYASSAHKTVSEVTAYISAAYAQDLTLTDIAKKHFISPFYLSRIFKRITGMSFAEYINGVRIKEGEKLLVKTDMTITEIATAVGYKSCTHFGRIFKKLTGVSPSRYRK